MAEKKGKAAKETDEVIDEINDGQETREIPEIDSKYRMILLAAQRSKQLQRGANPRVNSDVKKTKPTRIAMEELKQKKIHFEILDEE
ncbi:MAG: DNA-directed RNA polymerase subunit omega [Pyrinomonadaceae bacterium]